ncbi:hypothetical protein BDD12DRAFT_810366 [Trichophaea hybrida]|nr:hypothetical protein BDD12DRAFT_810366 [Trichophaea hybrida]
MFTFLQPFLLTLLASIQAQSLEKKSIALLRGFRVFNNNPHCTQRECYSKSIPIHTVALFGDLQHPIEIAQRIPKMHQHASLLVSCDGREVLTKIRPLWSSKIHIVA